MVRRSQPSPSWKISVLLPFLAFSATASASWPEDVTLTEMLDHNFQPIGEPHPEDYEQLIRELGTVVANKPNAPAETLGAYGFDVSIANNFVFIGADGEGSEPSPWERAMPDESPTGFMFVPAISFRKGLAQSFDVGTTLGWVGMSRQGVFSGYARVGIFEGYQPAPDVSVQIGYSAYVGNVELNMGVFDAGVRVGTTLPFGAFPDINTAQFHPYFDYSLLRISATPRVPDDIQAAIGATRYGVGQGDTSEPPLTVNRLSIGFQLTAGTAHLRAAGSIAPGSSPGVNVGFGFTY